MRIDELPLLKCHRAAISSLSRLPWIRMAGMPEPADIAGEMVVVLLSRDRIRCDVPKISIALAVRVAHGLAVDHYRYLKTLKCDADKLVPLEIRGWAIPWRGPTAAEVAEAQETRRRILAGLRGSERRLVVLKAAGETTPLAAAAVGWHLRKAERFLQKLTARA